MTENPIKIEEKIEALRKCYSNLNSYLETCGDDEDLRAKKIFASHILEIEKSYTNQLDLYDVIKVN